MKISKDSGFLPAAKSLNFCRPFTAGLKIHCPPVNPILYGRFIWKPLFPYLLREGSEAANELPPTSISHRACKQTMKDVSATMNAQGKHCSSILTRCANYRLEIQ